jgi:Uncharacterized conserved protein related to C-terminal domain of eukaryotic chaperone, SACSIN
MKEEIIHRWLKKAENDIKVVSYLIDIEDAPTDIICFHCQQAIEKYLKAFLTYVDVKAKKTHDLRALLEMCIEKDKDFLNLPIDDISNLTEYAVGIRYPDEFYLPSIEESRSSYNLAIKVRDFILKKLNF